jgi:hypothetical protein
VTVKESSLRRGASQPLERGFVASAGKEARLPESSGELLTEDPRHLVGRFRENFHSSACSTSQTVRGALLLARRGA